MPVETDSRTWKCDACPNTSNADGDSTPSGWAISGDWTFCPSCLKLARNTAASYVATVRNVLVDCVPVGSIRSVGGNLAQKLLREQLQALEVALAITREGTA